MSNKFFFIGAIAILFILPLKVEAKEIVCNLPKFNNHLNYLSNSAYGKLNKQKWQTLVIENKNTKINIIDNAEHGLPLFETQEILGFSGEQIKVTCNGRAEYWVWKEEDSKKTIHIIFIDNKINILKAKGI